MTLQTKKMIEMHLLPFHIWTRTSRLLLAKCAIEEGKAKIAHTKLMHRLCYDQLRAISDERTSSPSDFMLQNSSSSL